MKFFFVYGGVCFIAIEPFECFEFLARCHGHISTNVIKSQIRRYLNHFYNFVEIMLFGLKLLKQTMIFC